MKTVSTFTTDTWLSGDYVDDRRPVIRASIEKMHMRRTAYRFPYSESTTWKHDGDFRTCLFNIKGPIRELPGIQSMKYSRSVDQDVATMTLVMANVQWIPNAAPSNDEDFDFPGWYTPNRGVGDFFDDWGYNANDWRGWIVPDRVIRTYEGYGTTGAVDPENDDHLYPSGVWLIDDVDLNSAGDLTITCRDIGRLLLDHFVFPPIIPYNVYPIGWEAKKNVPAPATLEPDGDWVNPDYDRDTNDLFLDAELLDGTAPAVSPDGTVHTHEGADAFDDDTATHWLSAGSEDPNTFEFIQGTMDPQDVAAVRVNVRGGPCKVYVSLFDEDAGVWKGAAQIPFIRADDGPDIPGAKIKYVKSIYIPAGDTRDIEMPKTYHNISKIRLTFQSRWDSGIGKVRTYRVAVQELKFCNAKVTVPGSGTVKVGNYADYSDIVKWCCAWAGFYWPNSAKFNRIDGTDPDNDFPDGPDGDWTLPKGGVYGDVRRTNVAGLVELGIENFDKKPLMDMIAYVRDIVGFDFWVDERGGACWRLPNLFLKGNYVMPPAGGEHATHTTSVLTLDERTVLMDIGVKLSSKNVRERIFVSDVNGNFGKVVHGYNPAPSGMKRVAGWTDQHFKGRDECARMADLIAIRQFHEYRKNTVTIAANPSLQIDDQVIIKERITGEGYLHRVLAIDSEWEAETGQWTYKLTTNWLGPAAFTSLAWHPERMNVVTKLYLQELGVYDPGD